MLELNIKFIDIHGKEIIPPQSRLIDLSAGQPKAPDQVSENCPPLVGGDTKNATVLEKKEKVAAQNCPKIATWYVKRHPIGFSLYIQDADAVLALFKEETEVKKLFETKLIQGIFYETIHSLSARAKDLNLEGVEGAFLRKLVIEALSAHGELHYDVAHGKNGFVFSFVRDECPYASTALPVMARYLSHSGYKILMLAEPVLELRVGLLRLFITQYENRVYLANGLEALLNVIESLTPPGALPKTPLVVAVRGQAFLDKIIQVMAGEPAWEADLGMEVSLKNPGVLQLTSGKFAKGLCPKIFKGVLAAIPHDAFSAVATSYYLSADMTADQWHDLATKGPGDPSHQPEEAGVAIVWDMDADTRTISDIGVIIANQNSPDKVKNFEHYFTKTDLTTEAGGGTVFMAATSQNLLTRMKDSCEKQSLSILDWERGDKVKNYESAQILMFCNPGAGIRELCLAGGAKSGDLDGFEFEPQWKQDYEKAKELMRADIESVSKSLPIMAYAGSVGTSEKKVLLKGLAIQQAIQQGGGK